MRSLAVHGDYLYWVDTSSKSLHRVNKMTGQDKQLVQGYIDEVTDVLVVDKRSFDGKFLCNGLETSKLKFEVAKETFFKF